MQILDQTSDHLPDIAVLHHHLAGSFQLIQKLLLSLERLSQLFDLFGSNLRSKFLSRLSKLLRLRDLREIFCERFGALPNLIEIAFAQLIRTQLRGLL